MANGEQVKQMIDLMKAQMEQVTRLQTENKHLGNVVMNANEDSFGGGVPPSLFMPVGML